MSWSAQATSVTSPDQVYEKLKSALDAQLEAQPFDSWDDDVAQQQEQALVAASEIVANGAVGKPPFTVTLSGHASRGTESNTMTISVQGTGQVGATE